MHPSADVHPAPDTFVLASISVDRGIEQRSDIHDTQAREAALFKTRLPDPFCQKPGCSRGVVATNVQTETAPLGAIRDDG